MINTFIFCQSDDSLFLSNFEHICKKFDVSNGIFIEILLPIIPRLNENILLPHGYIFKVIEITNCFDDDNFYVKLAVGLCD